VEEYVRKQQLLIQAHDESQEIVAGDVLNDLPEASADRPISSLENSAGMICIAADSIKL
jgi:hypothetical protein